MPEIGETLMQPELAGSLEMLAANGGRDFYEGKLAERIAAGLKKIGSPLTAEDLARCRARDEAPLRVGYRDGELIGFARQRKASPPLRSWASSIASTLQNIRKAARIIII